MAHSFHQNLAHIVFSTRNRQARIHAPWDERLYQYLGGMIRDLGGTALCINGMPDHVHLLVKTPKNVADSVLMRDLKCNSTNWVKAEGLQADFAWQEGYGWFSLGASMVSSVRDYIEKQKEHHRKMTFQEEFVRFLDKYQVAYDARYLWD